MIEEATTGVTDWADVQAAFQRNRNVTLARLLQSINETIPEVAEILNRTTTQVTNSLSIGKPFTIVVRQESVFL